MLFLLLLIVLLFNAALSCCCCYYCNYVGTFGFAFVALYCRFVCIFFVAVVIFVAITAKLLLHVLFISICFSLFHILGFVLKTLANFPLLSQSLLTPHPHPHPLPHSHPPPRPFRYINVLAFRFLLFVFCYCLFRLLSCFFVLLFVFS